MVLTFFNNIGPLADSYTSEDRNDRRDTKNLKKCDGITSHSDQTKDVNTLYCQTRGMAALGGGGRIGDGLEERNCATSYAIGTSTAVCTAGKDVCRDISSGSEGKRFRAFEKWRNIFGTITMQQVGNVYGEESAWQVATSVESAEDIGRAIQAAKVATECCVDASSKESLFQLIHSQLLHHGRLSTVVRGQGSNTDRPIAAACGSHAPAEDGEPGHVGQASPRARQYHNRPSGAVARGQGNCDIEPAVLRGHCNSDLVVRGQDNCSPHGPVADARRRHQWLGFFYYNIGQVLETVPVKVRRATGNSWQYCSTEVPRHSTEALCSAVRGNTAACGQGSNADTPFAVACGGNASTEGCEPGLLGQTGPHARQAHVRPSSAVARGQGNCDVASTVLRGQGPAERPPPGQARAVDPDREGRAKLDLSGGRLRGSVAQKNGEGDVLRSTWHGDRCCGCGRTGGFRRRAHCDASACRRFYLQRLSAFLRHDLGWRALPSRMAILQGALSLRSVFRRLSSVAGSCSGSHLLSSHGNISISSSIWPRTTCRPTPASPPHSVHGQLGVSSQHQPLHVVSGRHVRSVSKAFVTGQPTPKPQHLMLTMVVWHWDEQVRGQSRDSGQMCFCTNEKCCVPCS